MVNYKLVNFQEFPEHPLQMSGTNAEFLKSIRRQIAASPELEELVSEIFVNLLINNPNSHLRSTPENGTQRAYFREQLESYLKAIPCVQTSDDLTLGRFNKKDTLDDMPESQPENYFIAYMGDMDLKQRIVAEIVGKYEPKLMEIKASYTPELQEICEGFIAKLREYANTHSDPTSDADKTIAGFRKEIPQIISLFLDADLQTLESGIRGLESEIQECGQKDLKEEDILGLDLAKDILDGLRHYHVDLIKIHQLIESEKQERADKLRTDILNKFAARILPTGYMLVMGEQEDIQGMLYLHSAGRISMYQKAKTLK